MVQGRDRRPELAYKLALECRQSDAFVALSLIRNRLMMVMMMNHIKPNLENNDVNHDIGNVTAHVNTMYYILLCLFTLIFYSYQTLKQYKNAPCQLQVFLRQPAVITRGCCLVDDIDSGGSYI